MGNHKRKSTKISELSRRVTEAEKSEERRKKRKAHKKS